MASKPSWKSPVGRVRWIALAEGVSFLVLLGIAMPLKHLAGLPLAVRYVGWAHGVLFVALMLVLAAAWGARKLSTGDAARVVIASLLPFGPFVLDRRLARDEEGD